jgi:hypothetical protein
MALQHLRSSTASKRPDPAAMADGQLAINTAAASTGLFYKNASGALVKAGPVHIGTTAPNATPASGGHAGHSLGESWLDTAGGNPVLKIWDGSAWQIAQPVASGTVVSTTDTGSVTSTMIADGTIVNADINSSAAIAGTKVSPSFGDQDIVTTGNLTLNAQGDLRFGDSDSSNWVAFQAPATVSSNVTWTLPAADGTTGQVLSTNGSGTLSWATGGGGGGGASVTTSDTAPNDPADGDLWYDSIGGRMYVYYEDPNTSQWVDAAPQGGGDAGFSKLEVGNTKAEVTDTGSNGTFTVTTEGTSRLTVGSTGNVSIANGNLVFSTAGTGIDFSATANSSGTMTSELLSDYEEGTWTPVDGSGAGLSFTNTLGTYTKIGRQVRCNFSVLYPSTANGSTAQIGGLPFTAATLAVGGTNSGPVGYCTFGALNLNGGAGTVFQLSTPAGADITNASMSGKALRATYIYHV